jgi:hypothetical protein
MVVAANGQPSAAKRDRAPFGSSSGWPGKDTIAVVFDLGYCTTNRGGFGRPFCLLANTDYVPTPNEMRLRLELTRYQPIAAATIAPLSVANAWDRRELPLNGNCRPAI